MTMIANPKRGKAKEDNKEDQDKKKVLTTKTTHTCSQHLSHDLIPTTNKKQKSKWTCTTCTKNTNTCEKLLFISKRVKGKEVKEHNNEQ